MPIDVHPYGHCVCTRMKSDQDLCAGEWTFSEKGTKVCLRPRPGDEVLALVLDNCVFTDNKPKCDGLFIFRSGPKKRLFLVELKSSTDIPHAFEQLAYVTYSRDEYRMLKQRLSAAGPGKVIEKSFVITRTTIPKPQKDRLENSFGIRVNAIIPSGPTRKTPDLREYVS